MESIRTKNIWPILEQIFHQFTKQLTKPLIQSSNVTNETAVVSCIQSWKHPTNFKEIFWLKIIQFSGRPCWIIEPHPKQFLLQYCWSNHRSVTKFNRETNESATIASWISNYRSFSKLIGPSLEMTFHSIRSRLVINNKNWRVHESPHSTNGADWRTKWVRMRMGYLVRTIYSRDTTANLWRGFTSWKFGYSLQRRTGGRNSRNLLLNWLAVIITLHGYGEIEMEPCITYKANQTSTGNGKINSI